MTSKSIKNKNKYQILFFGLMALSDHLDKVIHRQSDLEPKMPTRQHQLMSLFSISVAVSMGLTACGSAEPSCKDYTATETLRKGIERDLLAMQIYGQRVQVTKAEGSPIEKLQFGVICQAVIDISGVDISKIATGGDDEPSKIVDGIQMRMGYRVDQVNGELVTRWDASNLFQVVGIAANLKAAGEAGLTLPGHSPGTPGR